MKWTRHGALWSVASAAISLFMVIVMAWAQNATTLQLSENAELGAYLVDARGHTLYFFDGETTCTGFCTNKWPPLVGDEVELGEGLDSALLGTVALEDGRQQVTYGGHPLHTYSSDSGGSTNGQGVSGFGGAWTAIAASGEAAAAGETALRDGGANKTQSSGGETGTQAASSEASAPKDYETLNPHTGDPAAVEAGQALYTRMNCYGCHGREGGGGMGPSLVDAQWNYAGDDATVFETVHSGRPNGMPAFGENLSEDEIWQVVAFVRSLYKGPDEGIRW